MKFNRKWITGMFLGDPRNKFKVVSQACNYSMIRFPTRWWAWGHVTKYSVGWPLFIWFICLVNPRKTSALWAALQSWWSQRSFSQSVSQWITEMWLNAKPKPKPPAMEYNCWISSLISRLDHLPQWSSHLISARTDSWSWEFVNCRYFVFMWVYWKVYKLFI